MARSSIAMPMRKFWPSVNTTSSRVAWLRVISAKRSTRRALLGERHYLPLDLFHRLTFEYFRAIIDVHDEIIAPGQNTVYFMIVETQQFTSSLSFNKIRTPKLHWSESMDRISIAGETLKMTDFRAGIQDLIKDTHLLLDRLTGGQRFATELPVDFRDNLPSTERGYSWLSHGPFTKHPNALLAYLIHQSEWEVAHFDESGDIAWNLPALHQIMGISAQVNANLMLLNFVISDNRGSQMNDQQIANALAPRHLYRVLRDMVWFTRRTKTSNITGSDVCIPCFVPPVIAELNTEYLAGGIRDIEILFAGILYGPEIAGLYRT